MIVDDFAGCETYGQCVFAAVAASISMRGDGHLVKAPGIGLEPNAMELK